MRRPEGLPDDVRPDFQGFSKEAFSFLLSLAHNNRRDWFVKRKDVYDSEIKFAAECLLAEFTTSARLKGFPLQGHPKRGLFRIYRDVRFSRDKLPYKTHAGMVLTRTGNKGEPGFLYAHVQPGKSFLAAGFFAMAPEFLLAWRTRIAEDPETFLKIVEPLLNSRTKHRLVQRGEPLKTMPRGFKDHADSLVEEYLRWKSCMVRREITDRLAQSRSLIYAICDMAAAAGPLLHFGWEISDSLHQPRPRSTMRGKPRKA